MPDPLTWSIDKTPLYTAYSKSFTSSTPGLDAAQFDRVNRIASDFGFYLFAAILGGLLVILVYLIFTAPLEVALFLGVPFGLLFIISFSSYFKRVLGKKMVYELREDEMLLNGDRVKLSELGMVVLGKKGAEMGIEEKAAAAQIAQIAASSIATSLESGLTMVDFHYLPFNIVPAQAADADEGQLVKKIFNYFPGFRVAILVAGSELHGVIMDEGALPEFEERMKYKFGDMFRYMDY